MSGRRRIGRRALLLACAAAGLAAREEGPLAAAASRLRAATRHPLSAAAVGKAYVARFPEEADQHVLTALILDALKIEAPEAAARDERALAAAIAGRVRRDFAEGATAAIAGWILSRTEARLCALWV